MKNPILGVDVGGTKIRSVLWDGRRVLGLRETKTPPNLADFRSALKQHSKILKNVGMSSKREIGIAVPGIVRGTVFVSATNLPYIRNLDFAKLFPGAEIKVDHDARCFARAAFEKRGDGHAVFFLALGTGVGRAVARGGKILKIKKFEYSERWEKEYQKIRDLKNNRALAGFLAKKLDHLLKAYGVGLVIVGGGVASRFGFLAKLQKALVLPIKKSKFGKNSVAIGAAMIFADG